MCVWYSRRLLDDNVLCEPFHKVHVEEVGHQSEHRLLGRPTVTQSRLLAAHVGEAIQRGGTRLGM